MGVSRLNWTDEEQQQLKKLKETDESCGWQEIAERLNKMFTKSQRTAKQCRERYMNFARFKQENTCAALWEPEQDELLLKIFLIHGSHWVLISSQMPNRSQNSLKNRFYGILRKITRKIILNLKLRNIKNRKALNQKNLIQIFHAGSQIVKEHQIQCKILKNQQHNAYYYSLKIFQLRLQNEETQNDQYIDKIVRYIYKFADPQRNPTILDQKKGKIFQLNGSLPSQNTEKFQDRNQQQQKNLSSMKQRSLQLIHIQKEEPEINYQLQNLLIPIIQHKKQEHLSLRDDFFFEDLQKERLFLFSEDFKQYSPLF